MMFKFLFSSSNTFGIWFGRIETNAFKIKSKVLLEKNLEFLKAF